ARPSVRALVSPHDGSPSLGVRASLQLFGDRAKPPLSGVWRHAPRPWDPRAGTRTEGRTWVVPLSSWGQEYVAPRHPHRVPHLEPQPEPVYWRVIAAADSTTITLNPPVAGVGSSIDLANIGDWYEFSTPE